MLNALMGYPHNLQGKKKKDVEKNQLFVIYLPEDNFSPLNFLRTPNQGIKLVSLVFQSWKTRN